MIQKHRISTNIGEDQKITVELKQDYDFLEILSLKFTQKEAYTSLCADYGVVCGRITANNGLGVPNARISIFVPQNDIDANDPVISTLYPYTSTTDKDDNNYRYNLLPARKQHGGHTPTGTFFDQTDILTREEVLEVYENYYSYTVKTNSSGDFMIWGVPLGQHKIHVDVDLSDMGCFSIRPYDFIRQGVDEKRFDRFYNFKSDSDIDGLEQIVKFEKTIEVYPFWGNVDLCEIGITRTDFDLSEIGIKIEPISLLLLSSVTDSDADAIKRTGVIRAASGYKCNLQTGPGTIEGVRHTGNKVIGSDGTSIYPELEYFTPGVIEGDGTAMAILPMNLEYVYTNEFGEQEITNDPNKGIATTAVARFRVTLSEEDVNPTKGTSPASYLIPNIREFNRYSGGGNGGFIYGTLDSSYSGEYSEALLSTYSFSNVFEDYFNVLTPTGVTLESMTVDERNHKRDLMLGTDNNGVPEDYFYKFIYGKVYTPTSFQGSHYEISTIESVLGLSRRDAFLGIKQIRPSSDEDCSGTTNYVPTNFAFRNRLKFSLLIAEILLFVQYIYAVILIWAYETLGSALWSSGRVLRNVKFPIFGHALGDFARDNLMKWGMRIMEGGQTVLPLTTYPDCEECTVDVENSEPSQGRNLDLYCRSAEIKLRVVPYDGYIYLLFDSKNGSWLNSSTVTGSTFLPSLFPNEAAKESCATGITVSQLSTLHNSTIPTYPSDSNSRYVGKIYPLVGTNESTDTFSDMYVALSSTYAQSELRAYFQTVSITTPTNGGSSIRMTADSNSVTATYVDVSGGAILATENITVSVLLKDNCSQNYRTVDLIILKGSSSASATIQMIDCNGSTVLETYERVSAIAPTKYREFNTDTSTSQFYTNQLALKISYSYWALYGGIDYANGGIENIRDLYAVLRIYDRNNLKDTTPAEIEIEQGCAKYDKFYDEPGNLYTYLWGRTSDYGTTTYPSNQGNGQIDMLENWAGRYRRNYNYGIPYYPGSPYRESLTSPGSNYTILAAIAGQSDTLRLPTIASLDGGPIYSYNKKTKSGLTEIRDGVFTIVPVIEGRSRNNSVIREWYKRKRIGLFFCGGVLNYSFIDNWLNGILYFFKFDYRIKWDNVDELDLNQRGSKFPRELIFFNILDQKFYYRSTPYNPTTKTFVGQSYSSYKELLHPTTLYDVGVRDEFLYEICYDPKVDPNCSVVRDISASSYQDPGPVMEHAINYRLDASNSKFDVSDFFNSTTSYNFGQVLDGDITQLMSINNEVGIEAFDLDTSKYFMFNGEYLDPENQLYSEYFKKNGDWGPTPIDFKIDDNGRFVRLCLNNRLGDYTQKVPFFLWDKKGSGFGAGGTNSDKQSWDRTKIAVQPLQRIVSTSGITYSGQYYSGDTTNYAFPDGEEEYMLMPMTINHGLFSFEGNYVDMVDRFDVIKMNTIPNLPASGFTEGDLWLSVTNGTLSQPELGNIYVISGGTWNGPIPYEQNNKETFIFPTAQNYSGNKQVLSTGFQFYFGLRPGSSSLDRLIKYYGPKGAFPPAE
jgi:hypothetical protein